MATLSERVADLAASIRDKINTVTNAVNSKVASVGGTAPIVSTGGTAPVISINPATTTAAGSMSAADKAKVDGAAPLASPALTGTPTAPTAATATSNTQIATTAFVKAQGYAAIASPAFTGTPTAPTAATATNSTQIATTAYVQAQGYATTSALAPKGFNTFCAGKPTASEVIGGFISPYAFNIVQANCVFRANTAAAASTVFAILNNGTQIGTATFAANATTATVSITTPAIASGAFVTIVAPSTPDNNLSDIAAIVRA